MSKNKTTMCGPPVEGWRDDVKVRPSLDDARIKDVFNPGQDMLWEPRVPPRSDLRWVGIDLDGTLAEPLWTPDNPTSRIGAPIARNVAKLKALAEQGYKPIIHTSRAWTDYELIETWLLHHEIPFKEIQCGKPLFAVYVDDRAVYSEDDDWTPHDKR